MDIEKRFQEFNLVLLNIVGKGTYGNVYLCKRLKDKKLTIIKDIQFNSKILNHTQDIYNEIKILSRLKHPNIIEYFDNYYYGDYVMISMEYASNGNLSDYMYQTYPNMLKQNVILFFYCQILLGVQYIHTFDIIHRDLKAENILLTGRSGVIVKIGDFGVSKILASAKKTSTVIGTPYYLAPELCDGKPYDTKSDIWALGCLLYEMCTHRRAFESETLVGLVKAITSGSVNPIDFTLYDRGVQELIDCMLSILPEKRPNIEEIIGKQILLPVMYTVYLDAGDDDLLLKSYNNYRS